MKFTFFTVVAAALAAYHSAEAISQGDSDAKAVWDATAPFSGLLSLFLTLNIAMTPEQLSSYLETLEPGIREFIVIYLSQHYSEHMDNKLKSQLAASMDGDREDIKSAVLHYLANDILEHEDMRDLAAQKGLETKDVASFKTSLKTALKGLLG